MSQLLPSMRRAVFRVRRAPLQSWVMAIASSLALFAGTWAAAEETLNPSGAIRVEQVQVAFIGSGNLGGGELDFQGKTYEFTVGGLGVGGFGLSRIEAVGQVYNLTRLSDFSGMYVQARYGMAAGDVSAGELWLQNTNGVVIGLDAERSGLALSLGGDAVYIEFD